MWTNANALSQQAYELIVGVYQEWYDKLKHKPEFLFEEAQCLGKTGQPAEAVRILEWEKRLNGKPMICYMIVKKSAGNG